MFNQALTNEPHATAEACANIIHDDAATECEETDLQELAANQVKSMPNQQHQLPQALEKHACFFEGLDNEQLGTFLDRKCHIDLNLGAEACHIKQPHLIPLNQMSAVKTEIKRQVDLGIIKKCCATEWGMPMFVVPKTDGSCRLIADF